MKSKLGTITKSLLSSLALASGCSAAFAVSGDYTVDAYANSTSGGIGKATFNLAAGQAFTVMVDADDLWNSGALPRWSSANGQNTDRYFSPTTDSEVATWYSENYGATLADGTLIGTNWGSQWSQGGLTASYGALVGQIGSGDFFLIGSSFSGVASASGQLRLYYWDSNYGDNSGSITARVTAVPEPETYAMMLAGLSMVGLLARRRRRT